MERSGTRVELPSDSGTEEDIGEELELCGFDSRQRRGGVSNDRSTQRRARIQRIIRGRTIFSVFSGGICSGCYAAGLPGCLAFRAASVAPTRQAHSRFRTPLFFLFCFSQQQPVQCESPLARSCRVNSSGSCEVGTSGGFATARENGFLSRYASESAQG